MDDVWVHDSKEEYLKTQENDFKKIMEDRFEIKGNQMLHHLSVLHLQLM